jgi:hypothetical protein
MDHAGSAQSLFTGNRDDDENSDPDADIKLDGVPGDPSDDNSDDDLNVNEELFRDVDADQIEAEVEREFDGIEWPKTPPHDDNDNEPEELVSPHMIYCECYLIPYSYLLAIRRRPHRHRRRGLTRHPLPLGRALPQPDLPNL